jgi:hypothetical protein
MIFSQQLLKSINHKGGRALRNSPAGYFSEGARLQREVIHKGHKDLKYRILTLWPLSLPCLPAGRFVFFVVKKLFQRPHERDNWEHFEDFNQMNISKKKCRFVNKNFLC